MALVYLLKSDVVTGRKTRFSINLKYGTNGACEWTGSAQFVPGCDTPLKGGTICSEQSRLANQQDAVDAACVEIDLFNFERGRAAGR